RSHYRLPRAASRLRGSGGMRLLAAVALCSALVSAQTPAKKRTWIAAAAGAVGGVLGASLAKAVSPESAPAPHRFWLDRWNTPLITGIATVQVLDFTSTRYFRDRGKDEWLLTNPLVDNRPAFTATEISAAAAGIGLSYLFHRSGHHRLERWAAAGYIAFGAVSAVANYRYPATGHALF